MEQRQNFEEIELGDPAPRGRSRPGTADERSPNRPSDYFNYHPPVLTLVLSFVVWLMLLLVCFVAPSGGLTAIFTSGGDYIGVLRKCTASSCDAWMATDTSSSSSPASLISSQEKRAPSSSSADAGGASTSDLSNFYLTTGLAALASFWLMTYTLLFIIVRYFSSHLPSNPNDRDQKPDTKDDGGRTRRFWRSIKNPFKRFAFRTSRIFLFFLSWTMLGVALDATIKVFSITGGSGFGTGVILLHLSYIFLFFLTYIELSRGSIRRKSDLSIWGCKCLQFCPSYNRRARRKWEDYDAARGGEGASEKAHKKKKDKKNKKREGDEYDDA
ncbi:hypothetical protein I302_107841 [Kwoniella bestiolae CBS 10118]|uniref:Uncharacterized protein n=1 Tax=Kwoniella bestiolae CBS 10118 TaxID=1296100 RepID=A0A1B9FXE6_9TREE|nr:hypothetical protein I302_06419 [Kwoniella bestiolae CBS 10118]OCF23437.1 hypothetical protein I302_06419 [Kwoniella bestiolae CBS 10118]